MSQTGGDEPGFGRQPEGGWPDFRAPGQSGPAGPPQAPPPQAPPPQAPPPPPYAQPWQQPAPSSGPKLVVLFAVIVGIALTLVIAVSVILVTRDANKPQPVPKPAPAPSSAARRPSPEASSEPSTDAWAKALQATGMVCVRANVDPVITVCDNKPPDSFTEVRWLDDAHGTMISFQIYAKFQSDRDRMNLTKRVQMMKLAGLGGSDISKITKDLTKVRKHTSRIDVPVSWGSVDLQYIKPAHAVELLGDKRGHSDASYDGKVFDGKPSAIMARLRKKGYRCSLESQSLTCTHGEVYLSMYGSGKGMTTLSLSERNPAADQLLLELLPTLLGTDVGTVLPLVESGMKRSFYLGAVSGYVVLVQSNYVSLEAISW